MSTFATLRPQPRHREHVQIPLDLAQRIALRLARAADTDDSARRDLDELVCHVGAVYQGAQP